MKIGHIPSGGHTRGSRSKRNTYLFAERDTSVTLGAHFDSFITKQMKEGRFNSVSEAIRAGLRLLEEREAKVKALQLALIDGEKSGVAAYSLEKLSAELDG